MATITLRSVKGSPLTNTEVDNNFTNLNNDKLESSSYTAADVLTKIKTVDGAASGLDADLLDGQQGSYYAALSGSTFTGNVTLGDSVKTIFGTGSDLEIYHDGSHSYITDAGTGNLKIAASQIDLLGGSDGAETMATFVDDGAATLYYDNSAKIATSSTGVTVTGSVTCDGINLGDNEAAYFGTGNDLQIYHDGSNSIIADIGTGSLYLTADTGVNITAYGTGETMAQFVKDGAVNLYYNNSTKFSTSSSGVTITGDLAFDQNRTIDLNGAGNSKLQNPADGGSLTLTTGSTSGYVSKIDIYAGSASPANAITFTTASAERMRIDSSGNLGIGTSSPSTRLSLQLSSATTYTTSTQTNQGLTIYNSSATTNGFTGIEFAGEPTSGNGGIAGIGSVVTGSGSANLVFGTRDSASYAERARISSAGGFSVGTTADPGAGAIYATGNITAYYSDERLKTIEGEIPNALEKISQISGVYYTQNQLAESLGFAKNEQRQVGVIAQQIKEILPEVVKPAPFDLTLFEGTEISKSGQHYMTVQYEKLVPLLVQAIKELKEEVDRLKGEA